MGFTTAFVSSVTLTTSILYLSLNVHQRNRAYQSALLRQQASVLNTIVEPEAPPPPPTAREERTSLIETAKDRWNVEVEGAVRWAQGVQWGQVREKAEEKAATIWARLMEKGREEVQKVEKK